MNHVSKAKVGDIIRAFDFAPCAGRDDAFVEGIVEQVNCTEPGYNCFKITVTADKFQKYETKALWEYLWKMCFRVYRDRRRPA